MRRPMRGVVVALVVWGALLLRVIAVSAQETNHALDVPYVAQSEALCGGAASAMVLRYWGARGIDAEQFAGALNSSRDGIETGALVDAIVAAWRRDTPAFPNYPAGTWGPQAAQELVEWHR